MKRFTADNFSGCLVGGAIGDALGYFIEFISSEEIFDKYGEDGLGDFSQEEGDVFISDDTQMTLFTANGLLYYEYCGRERGESLMSCMFRAYLDWLRTQQGDSIVASDIKPVSWLINVDELCKQRAPGNTCLTALRSGSPGTVDEPVNNSKGCGGIMRVAPVGLFIDDPDRAADVACGAAALTHGHPLGYISSAAYAYIINRIVYTEDDLPEIIEDCVKMLVRKYGSYSDTAHLIDLLSTAVEMASEGIEACLDAAQRAQLTADPQPTVLAPQGRKHGEINMKEEAARIEQALGGGWVAEETLAIAVYCCLKYGDDFESAVRVAANHSGDSDSTASLAGAIMGAAIGNSNMPTKYVMLLEMYDVIHEVAMDLYNGCPVSGDQKIEDDEVWKDKYERHIYV